MKLIRKSVKPNEKLQNRISGKIMKLIRNSIKPNVELHQGSNRSSAEKNAILSLENMSVL